MISQWTVIHPLKKRRLPFAALIFATILIAAIPPRAEAQTRSSRAGSGETAVSALRDSRSQDGHLMRRIGFGPTAAELDLIARIGNYRYLVQQLYPDNIDDSAMQVHLDLLQPDNNDPMGYIFFPQRWYLRMVYSRRQLQEKMTLFWHEHFATSVNKAGMLPIMLAVQEEGRRIADALGDHKAVILRNHGLLTVGKTVDEAAWWFITMERSCHAQLLAEAAGEPYLIGHDNAKLTCQQVGSQIAGWFQFQPLYARIAKEQPDLFE